MIMVLDRLDELSERFAAMHGSAGEVRHRVEGSNPKVTLNTHSSPGLHTHKVQAIVMTPVAHALPLPV